MGTSRWSSLITVSIGAVLIGAGGTAAVGIGPFAPTDCPEYVLSVADWSASTPDAPVTSYESLTEYQQERVRAGVEADGSAVPLNGTRWKNGGDPSEFVEYRGTVYQAIYYLVECNEFQELYRVGGPVLMLVGVAFVNFGSYVNGAAS